MPSRFRSFAIILLLCGCQSARAGTPEATENTPAARPFFCERSYTNHARGYQYRGIYVDSGGAVFSFRHARGDSRLLRVHADSMTEQALLARYAPGRTRAATVPAAEMAQRYAQVLQAREGAPSDRRRRGADMGAVVTRCYLPDAAGVYREVLLRQTGDWQRENTSPAAAQLSRWLDSLALRARGRPSPPTGLLLVPRNGWPSPPTGLLLVPRNGGPSPPTGLLLVPRNGGRPLPQLRATHYP
jgi:hypothetical protein